MSTQALAGGAEPYQGQSVLMSDLERVCAALTLCCYVHSLAPFCLCRHADYSLSPDFLDCYNR